MNRGERAINVPVPDQVGQPVYRGLPIKVWRHAEEHMAGGVRVDALGL